MKKKMSMKKKIILVVVVLLLLVVGAPVAALAAAIAGNTSVDINKTLAEGKVVTVLDGFAACYLVREGPERWMLVDACMDPTGKAILEALDGLGGSADQIDLILLTHGHQDHVGGVAAFPQAEVRALEAALPLLEGKVGDQSPIGKWRAAQDSGVRVKQPLRHGERLVVGGPADGVDVEVFAVPGHTAGSAVFLIHGVLFFGDSAGFTQDGALKGAPWVFSDDTDQNRRSLVALAGQVASRPIKHLVFGHTGAADGASALQAFKP